MGNHPSKAFADSQTSETIDCGPQRIQFCKSSTPDTLNDDRGFNFWECTTCGRQYVDAAVAGPFIAPPPTTECVMIQANETWTHANGGFVNLSITGGATCDYVRVVRVVGERDHSEQIASREDAVCATDIHFPRETSAQACDASYMKVEGEHGRISRVNGVVDASRDEDDPDDCEFWKTQCEDVDCIYEGGHCRYQCAIAESDEEPRSKAPAPKRCLRFRRSAP